MEKNSRPRSRNGSCAIGRFVVLFAGMIVALVRRLSSAALLRVFYGVGSVRVQERVLRQMQEERLVAEASAILEVIVAASVGITTGLCFLIGNQ